ncbi:MAG: hypothetical protein M1838_000223 [Thelocarpon superellum]|nr:MAG: hypothetical protein M1838_000223 [Thelocarpon superellum]
MEINARPWILPNLSLHEFGDAHDAFRLLVVSLASVLFISIYRSQWSNASASFKNKQGQRIKEIKEDSRFSRFSHGLELSQQGQRLAGSEPYLVRNGRNKELVISAPDQAREFFAHDAKDHMKPANMNLGHYFGRVLGNCVGVQGGAKWNSMRALFNPEFSHLAAKNMIPLFTQEFSKWAAELSQDGTVVSKGEEKFVIDAAGACRILPFRLIARTCYGNMLTDETFDKLLSFNEVHEQIMCQAVFGRWTTSKYYGMLPTKAKRQMDQFQKGWEAFNLDIVVEARKSGTSCPAEKIYDGVDPKGDISKQEFLETVDEILFTNIDVTSAVLAFVLINLAANRPFQDKLRTEIREQLAAASGDIGHYLAKTDTLLNYASMESVRFSLPERTAQDKVIGGYLIPAGTPGIIDWKRLNTQSEVWGSDGETFRPERFLEISQKQYRYSLLRFGVGPRKCLGKNMADVMIKLAMIIVLEKYHLSGVDGQVALRKDRFTCTPQQLVKFSKV